MRVINKISDDLIEIREYAKPNACFQTNEYPDSYDFVVLREIFNPFDLFNDNKIKDMEIERLNNIINEAIDYLREIEKFEKKFGFDGVRRKKLLNILQGSDKK